MQEVCRGYGDKLIVSGVENSLVVPVYETGINPTSTGQNNPREDTHPDIHDLSFIGPLVARVKREW